MNYHEMTNDQLAIELDKVQTKTVGLNYDIPNELQAAIRERFNEAIGNIMEGDTGFMLFSVGHGYDLLNAVVALKGNNNV